MSTLKFDKLEGLGNDFVLIDCRDGTQAPDEFQAARIADRHSGIGCDQVLAILSPREQGHCAYSIRNADGSCAVQCGNGARCIGWWLHLRGETAGPAVLESPGGLVTVTVEGPELVRASLQEPTFPKPVKDGQWPAQVKVDGRSVQFYPVDTGNPHAVVVRESGEPGHRLESLGPAIEASALFPDGVNVGLVEILDHETVKLQVHERGSGITRACGSGACAAACALIRAGLATSPVSVLQAGGSLVIEWKGEGFPIQMTGPARWVFKGEIECQNVTQ